MPYHVLNGDALVDRFMQTGIGGSVAVCREALIDGPLYADSLNDFWQQRAAHHQVSLDEYRRITVTEFEKLLAAPAHSSFHLWFGYDLFCQANMWFVLSLLHHMPEKQVSVVYPAHLALEKRWNDFGGAAVADLKTCFEKRIPFGESDLELGRRLWQAYRTDDRDALEKLSHQQSVCFPHLREVCEAHIDRFPTAGQTGRPQKVVKAILQNHPADFGTVFREFFICEGVYGFGDVQFKKIYDDVVQTG